MPKVTRSAIAALYSVAVVALFVATPATAANAKRPDVTTLTARFLHALGRDALKGRLKTEMTTASGFIENRVATYTMMRKLPNLMLETIKIDGTDIKEKIGFDGTTAWAQFPDGKTVELGGIARKWVLGLASGIDADLSTLKASEGSETDVDGQSYYVLQLRDRSGDGTDYYIDEQTYLPAYERLTAGSRTHFFAIGPLDKGPMGEYYPREQQVINVDGTLGNPATVTQVDDNIPLPDSMFAPPGQ